MGDRTWRDGPAPPTPSESTDLALGAVAVGAVLVGVLWLAGAASAWVSGHRVPHGDLLAGARRVRSRR